MNRPRRHVALAAAVWALCGYLVEADKFSAVEDNKVLNIHLVPHTHDDVGWLKTVEQYYYGRNQSIQPANVQSILDTTMAELGKNSNRTFTYVELKFFSMWWEEQSDATKASVQQLVDDGQLDFANGGWCMHDEASTHYMGMVDQTTLGHQYLKRELGVVPTVGWQLDPFGHSATQASLLAGRVGFDALYFGRLDRRDLDIRLATQETHALWSSSPNLHESVFWGLTGSYSGNYYWPRGFNAENPRNYLSHNVSENLGSMNTFMERVKTQSDQTKGNNIMMTMGGDFQYSNATLNFEYIDIIIESLLHLQSTGEIDTTAVLGPRFESINVFYSTPAYFTSQKHLETTRFVSDENNTSLWSVKTDDFFPYSDCNSVNCYWTGYFTSRASLKKMERVASSFLLAARQIEALPGGKHNGGPPPLLELEDAVGVLQHHDGVSGTSKQHVAYDYAKKLQAGINRAATFVEHALQKFFLVDKDSVDLTFCQLLNETICNVDAAWDNTSDLYLVVYNALASNRSAVIGIPVPQSASYSVAKVESNGVDDENAVVIPSLVVPPMKSGGAERHVVYLDTGAMEPLGASIFRLKQTDDTSEVALNLADIADPGDAPETFNVSNNLLTVHFNMSTGVMTSIDVKDDDSSHEITQDWGYYWSQGRDGAYRFVPQTVNQEATILTPKTGEPKVFQTDVATEVHVEYEEPWVKQVTRLLRGQPYVEVEFTVGPVPISDGRAKDVITRYSTPIQSNGTFYTDANGREFMKRVRNFRPSWDIDEREPVAGNYYPVNAAAYIEDDESSLSIVLDRSQGGSSQIDGSFELMVQRRLRIDDGLGVGEPLDETDGGIEPNPPYGSARRIGEGVIIKGKHRIMVGNGLGGASLARSQMDSAFSTPVVFMATAPSDESVDFRETSLSAVKSALPSNVMLVTFSLLHHAPETTFLIRLGHQYGKDEDGELSEPVVVDMSELFAYYEVVGIVEKTLTGNRDYAEWKQNRLVWTNDTAWDTAHDRSGDDNFAIELKPMEIRTFEVMVRDTSSLAEPPGPPPPPEPPAPPEPTEPESPNSSPRPTPSRRPTRAPGEQVDGTFKGEEGWEGSVAIPPAAIALIVLVAVFACVCALVYRRMRDAREPLPNGGARLNALNRRLMFARVTSSRTDDRPSHLLDLDLSVADNLSAAEKKDSTLDEHGTMVVFSRAALLLLTLRITVKCVFCEMAAVKDDRVLNVHIVPHTHDDVGWLKTVEQYYYGRNSTIQKAFVQSILDTVVQELVKKSNRTFTYVEVKFFSMWWEEQSDSVKATVRKLVANGQFSFANGGWCMHDEAATHYMGMIDQTTLGHTYLKKELGVVPTVGWQLDPFGHSSTQASLLSGRVGFDALYFGRIDYRDLELRKETQECEGLWSSSPNLNETVFWGLTGSYSGNYGPPSGFNFDVHSNDEPLVGLDHDHLVARIKGFLKQVKTQSDRTKDSNIMLTMGEDFQYEKASKNYANLDLLINSVLEFQSSGAIDIPTLLGPRFDSIDIFYSNPEHYTRKKHEMSIQNAATQNDHAIQTEHTLDTGSTTPWSVKRDDFFPYADCPHCYWTGYFTSRSSLKRLERVSSSFLHAARQIESMHDPSTAAQHTPGSRGPLYELEDAVGVLQHHDGVSGTSKQHVAYDYAKRVQSGIDKASKYVGQKLKRLLLLDDPAIGDLQFCQLLNETKCDVSNALTDDIQSDLIVVVYNGLSSNRSETVGIPVSIGGLYRISSGMGSHKIERGTLALSESMVSERSKRPQKFTLYFNTGPIDPIGAKVFRIRRVGGNEPLSESNATADYLQQNLRRLPESSVNHDFSSNVGSTFSASNGILTVLFDRSTGAMKKIEIDDDDFSIDLTQDWGYYTSFDSNSDKSNSDSKQASSAYIFRPSTPEQQIQTISPKQEGAKVFKTGDVIEVHVQFERPWVKQVTRLVEGQPYVEVEYTVGPIDIADNVGKEIITRYSTPIGSNQEFHTDANGREFLKRKRSYRPTWELNETEPVAGNYFPVNAATYIEDDTASLSLVLDRSQGGTSLVDGSIELMVQRRTIVDDWRGVGEPLNETDGGITPYPPYGNATRIGDGVIIKGKHRILVGKGRVGASLARSQMDRAFSEPVVFMASIPSHSPLPSVRTSFSALQSSLPDNVMLVTFSLLHHAPETTFLIRLGHQYGKDEDTELSKPVEVDMGRLFADYKVVSMVEKTLSGNRDYSEWKQNRLVWTASPPAAWKTAHDRSSDEGFAIELRPMEIRTFLVAVRSNTGNVPKER